MLIAMYVCVLVPNSYFAGKKLNTTLTFNRLYSPNFFRHNEHNLNLESMPVKPHHVYETFFQMEHVMILSKTQCWRRWFESNLIHWRPWLKVTYQHNEECACSTVKANYVWNNFTGAFKFLIWWCQLVRSIQSRILLSSNWGTYWSFNKKLLACQF